METREELLTGLHKAIYYMQEITKLQSKRAEIRKQYVSIKTIKEGLSEKEEKKKFILTVLGIMLIAHITSLWYIFGVVFAGIFLGNELIATLLAWVTVFILAFFLAKFIRKKKNDEIIRENSETVLKNKEAKEINNKLMEREQKVINEIQNVQKAYTNEVSSWYPGNYCYIEAAEFLYNAINNYRADSIKEAINLYEDTKHKMRMEEAQNQMLQNQNTMIRQQKLNNMLAMGNMVMQAGVLNAVNNNTQAIHSNTSAIHSLESSVRNR